jgi:hypothetical protein
MLGAYTKIHGTGGVVTISQNNRVLAAMFGVTEAELIPCIKLLPHVNVEEGTKRNGEFVVTWEHWQKYQEDSTVAERQKRFRASHRNGLRGEENKKRREENIKPPVLSTPPPNGFASWPPEWEPIRNSVATIPFLSRYKAWLADLSWWETMDKLFTSCPKNLDALVLEAAAYCEGVGYVPRTKRAIRLKLKNCMEFSARKAERDAAQRAHEQR